jgi:hypothetical protein
MYARAGSTFHLAKSNGGNPRMATFFSVFITQNRITHTFDHSLDHRSGAELHGNKSQRRCVWLVSIPNDQRRREKRQEAVVVVSFLNVETHLCTDLLPQPETSPSTQAAVLQLCGPFSQVHSLSSQNKKKKKKAEIAITFRALKGRVKQFDGLEKLVNESKSSTTEEFEQPYGHMSTYLLLTTALKHMSGHEVFSKWGLPFAFSTEELLPHATLRLLRQALKKYGFPGADDLSLGHVAGVGAKMEQWKEVCQLVDIEVPPIHDRYLVLQQEALLAFVQKTTDTIRRRGEDDDDNWICWI